VQSGDVIAGRYRLVEPIGAGGNGVVWRAVDEELDRVVALKHALPGGDEHRSARLGLLRREARQLARVNHPNVVILYNVVGDGDDCWLVMEYVPAPSLATRGVLPVERVARLGAQIADGLAAVHAAGVLHRDIKPGNVLVTDDDRAKLGDFGSSLVVEGDVTLPDTGLLAGTPGYVAPEIANGGDPTTSSDVFSLGATLFAAVEGSSPYGTADNHLALLRRAANGKIAEPRNSGALAPVLSRMMHREPARRPSAVAAKRMLAEITGATRPRRRHPLRIAVLTAASVAVIALVVVLVSNPPSSPPQNTHVASAPSTRSASPPSPAARQTQVVGDPHTADPCALLDQQALARFGTTSLNDVAGNFNRCDVMIQAGNTTVDIEIDLDVAPPAGQAPQGVPVTLAGIAVLRQPLSDNECDRMIEVGDGEIDVAAKLPNGGKADLCGQADVAAGSAAAVLAKGPIPRRAAPVPKWSLLNTDACALLDANALARFPGVDALNPEPAFGNWQCVWNSTTSSASLLVRFDRNPPLTAADGRPVRLAGHQAFVQPDGYGTGDCEVSVVHHRFTDDTGNTTVELLLVVVSGPQSHTVLCQQATALATPAAAALPAG
jgi:serine/threonine protein kinase